MSIDPIVPVHMAGQIFLDSSLLSTLAPVIGASLSGIVTVVATLFIVTWANKTTLGAIKEANDKSLSEMKETIGNSKEIAERSIIENRKLEERKLEIQAKELFLKSLIDEVVIFRSWVNVIEFRKNDRKSDNVSVSYTNEETRSIFSAICKFQAMLDPRDSRQKKILMALPEEPLDKKGMQKLFRLVQVYVADERKNLYSLSTDRDSDPQLTPPPKKD